MYDFVTCTPNNIFKKSQADSKSVVKPNNVTVKKIIKSLADNKVDIGKIKKKEVEKAETLVREAANQTPREQINMKQNFSISD